MILDTDKVGKLLRKRKVFTMGRRSFTSEFKREAASLVLDQGYSVLAACEAMDVGATAMRRWVEQLRRERGGETPRTAPGADPGPTADPGAGGEAAQG
jgi:transposase-like protein